MIKLRRNGWTLDEIGDYFGITRQRVCQLVSPKKPVVQPPKINLPESCGSLEGVSRVGLEVFEGFSRTRELIRRRDNQTCQACGKVWSKGTRRFDVHHLRGNCGKRSLSYDKIRDAPFLITLCHRCHLNLDEVKEKNLLHTSPRLNKPVKDIHSPPILTFLGFNVRLDRLKS